jgi:hypothetical protein
MQWIISPIYAVVELAMTRVVYRLFDKKRLNPQLFHLLSDLNEQKNQRYGSSSTTKQPLNIFFLALSAIANDSQPSFLNRHL